MFNLQRKLTHFPEPYKLLHKSPNTRSGTHQLLHTPAITSDLGNPHVTSVLQPHHYFTDRLPELTSPTARSVAPPLLSGTL